MIAESPAQHVGVRVWDLRVLGCRSSVGSREFFGQFVDGLGVV